MHLPINTSYSLPLWNTVWTRQAYSYKTLESYENTTRDIVSCETLDFLIDVSSQKLEISTYWDIAKMEKICITWKISNIGEWVPVKVWLWTASCGSWWPLNVKLLHGSITVSIAWTDQPNILFICWNRIQHAMCAHIFSINQPTFQETKKTEEIICFQNIGNSFPIEKGAEYKWRMLFQTFLDCVPKAKNKN